MARVIESLSVFNSTIRTMLALVIVGGLGYGGWLGYQTYTSSDNELTEAHASINRLEQEKSKLQQQNEQLTQEVAVKQQEIDRLAAAMKLLKVDHRLAKLKVKDVGNDRDTGEEYSMIEFVEVNDEGRPIAEPKLFKLKGDEIRVDGWVVKFDDKYIEEADLHRSTSLYVFKSIYGNLDGPARGYPLDEENARPGAYAQGGQQTDFEKKIWDDFWTIARDTSKQVEYGIRAIHGQVNYVKAIKGDTWRVELRASDGVSMKKTDEPANPPTPAA